MDLATQKRYYKKSLFLGSSVLMVGVWLKILHFPLADWALGLAFLMSLGYILIGLFQVIKSTYWNVFEKFFWSFGLLLFPFFVGFAYYHIVVKLPEKV